MNNKIRFSFYLILLSFLFFQACKKEKPKTIEIPKVVKGKVMVLNEGNFGWNNASIGI